MSSLDNYIKNYGTILFEESSINDVDNVIFSCLAYINFEDILDEKDITMLKAYKKYKNKYSSKEIAKFSYSLKKGCYLFMNIATTPRFKDVIISNYVKILDNTKQFCAVTFKLPDNSIYIAYEGTDDSIIGWKEDFETSYMFPVPSQILAVKYLNDAIKRSNHNVYVGGHSKGGNLAMTAAMYCKSYIKRRIKKVYNNDGPGFRDEEYNSLEYKIMAKKLRKFVPEDSMVGMILKNDENYITVHSNAHAFYQHYPFTWECYGAFFLKSTRSKMSEKFEDRIEKWLNNFNDKQREEFFESFFGVMEKSSITCLKELREFKFDRVLTLIKTSKNLDKDTKKMLINAFKDFIFEKEVVK